MNGGAAAASQRGIGGDRQRDQGVGRDCTRDPSVFKSVLARTERPLVVRAEGGIFSRKYRYLASYKGLVFFTKSPEPIPICRRHRDDGRRQDLGSGLTPSGIGRSQ